MKNYLARIALVMALALAPAGLASATILDFNTGVPAEISLGGNMEWWDDGGGQGHLYCERYDTHDYIYFTNPTTLNSFQMNAMPYENWTSGGVIGFQPDAPLAAAGMTIATP